MTDLNHAAYKLNQWMSEPNKTPQRLYRIKQYRSCYLAKLNSENQSSWARDVAALIVFISVCSLGAITFLVLGWKGIIY